MRPLGVGLLSPLPVAHSPPSSRLTTYDIWFNSTFEAVLSVEEQSRRVRVKGFGNGGEAKVERRVIRAGEAIRTVRENPKFMAAHMAQQVSMADMFDPGGLGIHFVAYLPFLESQANEEQLAKWRPGARMFSYMGAYAQTELGHGSNVRGLETTATFDKDKDEFVINSPTLTSMKWCAETTS